MNEKQKLKIAFVLAVIIGSVCLVIFKYVDLMFAKRIMEGL